MNEAQAQVEQAVNETTGILTNFFDTVKHYLPTLCFAIILALIGNLFSKAILKAVDKGLKRSNIDRTAGSFLHSLLRIALSTIIVIIALSILGVPMTSIITVIGTAGLAIGLALQDSLSNVAGGFLLLFSKPFKAGDYIKTSTAEGIVESISILYTKIKTLDNLIVYIPNGSLSNDQLINYYETPTRRLSLEFSISYDTNINLAKEILLKKAQEHPLTLNTPSASAQVLRHDSSAIVLLLLVWMKNEDYYSVQFDLLQSIKEAFDENQIHIPYQQIDVHHFQEHKIS